MPRSQMAESLFRAVADASAFEVASAGTTPGADLTGVAEVLAERGVIGIARADKAGPLAS